MWARNSARCLYHNKTKGLNSKDMVDSQSIRRSNCYDGPYLAGDIRMAKACMKCWTPEVFPQTSIWKRQWKATTCRLNVLPLTGQQWIKHVSITYLKERCSPLSHPGRTAQKMAQQVKVLSRPSNVQENGNLESTAWRHKNPQQQLHHWDLKFEKWSIHTNLSSHWWTSVWNCVSSRTLRVKLNRTLMASFRGWREQDCVWLPA